MLQPGNFSCRKVCTCKRDGALLFDIHVAMQSHGDAARACCQAVQLLPVGGQAVHRLHTRSVYLGSIQPGRGHGEAADPEATVKRQLPLMHLLRGHAARLRHARHISGKW